MYSKVGKVKFRLKNTNDLWIQISNIYFNLFVNGYGWAYLSSLSSLLLLESTTRASPSDWYLFSSDELALPFLTFPWLEDLERDLRPLLGLGSDEFYILQLASKCDSKLTPSLELSLTLCLRRLNYLLGKIWE